MVVSLCLGNQIFIGTFVSCSGTKSFGLGNLKPSNTSLHSQLLHRHRPITSELSATTQPNFTVTYLINSCGLSPQDAISASIKIKLQNPKRADSVLALFSNYGFSETQISKFVKSHPRVLVADPEKTLAPKIEFFVNVGFSRRELAEILTSNPHILSSSLEKRIVPTYNFLRSMISHKHVVAVLKRRSWMFSSYSTNVRPNIEFLTELGVPETFISQLVAYDSQVLMHSHEDLALLVNEVEEMGFDVKKSAFVGALRALCGKSSRSVYNRNREIYKDSWGWSDDDIASAFRRNPQCMIQSENKIMQTMDFVVNKMGWPARMIARYPVILCLSLEKRIIPRCCVVKVLMSKGLIDENMSLDYVLKLTENRFLDRFVTRYLDQVPQLFSVYEGELDFQDT